MQRILLLIAILGLLPLAKASHTRAERDRALLPQNFPKNPYPSTTQDPEITRKLVNVAAGRITRALGCVVGADDKKILRDAIRNWGLQVQKLGPAPRMTTARTDYGKLSNDIAWDYLDNSDICGSNRTDCYKILYRPLERLFTIFRQYDIDDRDVEEEISRIQTEINDNVAYLRSRGAKKPPCLIDRDEAKDPSPQPRYIGNPGRHSGVIAAAMLPGAAPGTGTAGASPTPRPASSGAPTPAFTDEKLAKIYDALTGEKANPVGVRKALEYFAKNRDKFKNQKYISFIDYTKNAMNKRFFVIDTTTLEVRKYQIAHGKNSGPLGGTPKKFSNEHGSRKSSLGAFRVAEIDNNNKKLKHKTVTWLDGLEDGKNNRARNRGAYMHSAWYVNIGGRSWGCPALSRSAMKEVQPLISGGSFMYIYSDVE